MKRPVQEELDFHIEERTRELIARGHEPVEARRLAEAAFGDRPEIQAQVERLQRRRERRGLLKGHAESVRHGIKGLVRQPGYAFLVSGTLALGLGATVAIFSVVHAVLLEPLPFDRADELLTIYETDPERAYRNPAPADFFDIREEIPAFSSVTAFVPRGGNLIGDGDPERIRFGDVSANFFQTLGVRPVLGRSFGPETVPPGVQVAVISHGLWTRRYGRDPDVLGRRINLDESLYEVVGVAPEGFDYPAQVSLWVAAPYDVPVASFLGADAPSLRDAWFHTVVGRLAPGQGPEIAGDQLASLAMRLRRDHAEDFGEAEIFVEAIRDSEVGDLRTALLLLMGATGLVLLIVAANVANLALVRAAGRAREWGVRFALGASRSRIIALVLTESLTLAVVGGGLGVLLAWAGVEALRPLVEPLLPVTTTLAVDGTAMGFALVLAVVVALGFGLFPALSAAGRAPSKGIDRGAGARSGSRRDRRLREALVTAEIALAVVLVMGGGLLMRSLVSLQQVDLGFDPTPLSTLSVGFPGSSDISPDEQLLYYERLTERIRALPGVEGVAWGQFNPSEVGAGAGLRAQEVPSIDGSASVRWHSVSAGYFETVGIEILAGRGFLPDDGADTDRVAVVNETLARRFFPGGGVVGQFVNTGLDGRTEEDWHWVRVVGVAADLRNMGPTRPAEPMLYRPLAQPAAGIIGGPRAVLHLRAPGAGPEIAEAVRNTVWEVNPDAPIDQLLQGNAIAGEYLSGQRLVLSLVGGFALLSLLLAALGVYGITRFAVQRRTREIGVRMAIGAERTSVVGLVVKQGVRPAAVGLGIGVGASLIASRLIESQLTGISPLDPPTYLVVPAILAGVSLLATWIPARRAARIDPVRAIRVE